MDDATPNPWALLRVRPWLELVWTHHLPAGIRAATDGTRIWITHGLSQRERRCALMHELIHIDHGHTGHQPPGVEQLVEAVTARTLLPSLDTVRRTLMLADGRIDVAAEELWVTEAVLRSRLGTAPPWAMMQPIR